MAIDEVLKNYSGFGTSSFGKASPTISAQQQAYNDGDYKSYFNLAAQNAAIANRARRGLADSLSAQGLANTGMAATATANANADYANRQAEALSSYQSILRDKNEQNLTDDMASFQSDYENNGGSNIIQMATTAGYLNADGTINESKFYDQDQKNKFINAFLTEYGIDLSNGSATTEAKANGTIDKIGETEKYGEYGNEKLSKAFGWEYESLKNDINSGSLRNNTMVIMTNGSGETVIGQWKGGKFTEVEASALKDYKGELKAYSDHDSRDIWNDENRDFLISALTGGLKYDRQGGFGEMGYHYFKGEDGKEYRFQKTNENEFGINVNGVTYTFKKTGNTLRLTNSKRVV